MLYCPQCRAEYREGFSVCKDCNVALAPGRPWELEGNVPEPLVPFRSNFDPRFGDRMCKALEKAGVEYVLVNKEDFLFNFIAKPPGSICVPRSQSELAEKVFLEEFGSEDEWNSAIESGALALAENYAPVESQKKWDPDLWYPEDATAEIWVADPPNLEEIVELSLRENQVHTRWEDLDDKSVLFVQPEDEARAREIVRQITEATPPE